MNLGCGLRSVPGRRGGRKMGPVSRHCARVYAAALLVLAPVSLSAQDTSEAPPGSPYTYDRDGTPKADTDKPAELLRFEEARFRADGAACETGGLTACRALWEAYEFGRGAPQNRPIAHILYSQSCEARDAEGCFNLARLHEARAGTSGKPDAAATYEMACSMGLADGCVELARMLRTSEGIERDPARSEALLRATCTKARGKACTALASILFNALPDDAFKGEFSLCTNRNAKRSIHRRVRRYCSTKTAKKSAALT